MSPEAAFPPALGDEIRERSGQDIFSCYQCHKCSGGCPVTFAVDVPLSGLVRALQLGLREEVLSSRLVWLCAGCRTCYERCPNGIDGSRVLDALKAVAQEENRVTDRRVAAFHQAFLSTVRRFGRAHELGMMAEYKLRTGTYFQDLAMGVKMLGRRKLRLLPAAAPGRRDLDGLFRKGVRYRIRAGRRERT